MGLNYGRMSSFLLIVVVLTVVAGVFFGYIRGVSRSFQKDPGTSSLQSDKLKDKQRELAQESEDKRRQVMEDMRQRMKDNQRKKY